MDMAVGRLHLMVTLAPPPRRDPAPEPRDTTAEVLAREQQWKAVEDDRERWRTNHFGRGLRW